MVEELFEDFIKHYKLPLQKIQDKEYIKYVSELLGFSDKWESFCNRVNERFDGSREKYRENYNKTKDKFLEYIYNLPEYQNFINMNMDRFSIQKPENLMSDIYNHSTRGRYFLSIDLKKANFQAFKYLGFFKDINTWEDLMKNFTDLPELIESKYLRSVLCGQLNPSRQITVEYYLVYNKILPLFQDYKLVSLLNDELIFEVQEDSNIDCNALSELIFKETGLIVSVEYFKMRELFLKSNISKKEFHFYMKNDFIRCLNSKLYLIAYKLLNKQELVDFDYYIYQDEIISKFQENFTLHEL